MVTTCSRVLTVFGLSSQW